jgi:hypothetical protein
VGGCDVMYGIGGENGVVIVREESGLEMPVGAISRLACAGVGMGRGTGSAVSFCRESTRLARAPANCCLPISLARVLEAFLSVCPYSNRGAMGPLVGVNLARVACEDKPLQFRHSPFILSLSALQNKLEIAVFLP